MFFSALLCEGEGSRTRSEDAKDFAGERIRLPVMDPRTKAAFFT